MKAAILGSSGLIGSHLVQQMLQDDFFEQVTLVVRKASGLHHKKLSEQVIDLSNEAAMTDALDGSDMVFCCVGTTQQKVKGDRNAYRKVDYDIPVLAATVARKNASKTYLLVSAAGANEQSRNFYLQLKGAVENAVIQTGLPAIHFFQPSILLGARTEKRTGETIAKYLMQAFGWLFAGSLKKYRAINAADVAKAMIAAAKKQTAGVHRYTYKEMMALITNN